MNWEKAGLGQSYSEIRNASARDNQSGLLIYRKAEEADIPYIKELALREIGISPKKLFRHKTFLVYLAQKPIGFISYRRINEATLYIYMMALEKEAQNQGLARPIVLWIIRQESKPVGGIMFRIYKINQQAIYASQIKYNYKMIKKLPNYYVFYKKLLPEKQSQTAEVQI